MESVVYLVYIVYIYIYIYAYIFIYLCIVSILMSSDHRDRRTI